MLLVSKKMTANMAKLSELEKNAIIEAARTSPNLIMNSALRDNFSFWSNNGAAIENLNREIVDISGFMAFTQSFRFSGTSNVTNLWGYSQSVYTEIGKEYTASCYYKFNSTLTTGANKVRLQVGSNYIDIEQTNTEWQRVTITVTATTEITTVAIGLIGNQVGVVVLATGFQMERGKVATDWGLNIQDILKFQNDVKEDLVTLAEATEPQRIIDTVILSTEYINAFNQKVDYEDIETLVDGEQMEAEVERIEQYITQVENDTDTKLSVLNSSIQQSAADILARFQMSAGVNLIRNSTGFFDLENWVKTGTVQAVANAELETKAIGAAFYSTTAFTLTQEIKVKPNTDYSFSFWQKKTTTGKAVVKLYNGSTILYEIGHATNTTANFVNPFIVNFKTAAGQNSLKIVIEGTSGTISYFSGLMLNEGTIALQWSSHSEEIANTNIRMNLNGLYVKNVSTGAYTIMNPTEFAGYANVLNATTNVNEITKIFTLNGDTTDVFKLNANRSIAVGPGTFIALTTGGKNGVGLFL